MSAGGGLTSKEIGLALGIPAGTVRYQLAQARHALASALGDYDDPREER
jgi:DNA-directed RNA polymerase specialized sigma24 family protein